MNDDDISDTLKAKADQLNGDDLIGGPIVVTITKANKVSDDQPVILGVTGGYQPFKPCKTMRRALSIAWGPKMSEWIGRSMKLYRDPSVKWAGDAIGGIRISHLSHIPKRLELFLTETRGKKKKTIIEVLDMAITQPQIVAMKTAWFNAVKAAGLPATKPDFEQFVTGATGGRVAASNVLVADKYSQQDLQVCNEAIARIGTRPDATDLAQQNDPAAAFDRRIELCNTSTDAEQLTKDIRAAAESGQISADDRDELLDRLQTSMA